MMQELQALSRPFGETERQGNPHDATIERGHTRARLLAAGGIIGAVLASSCCIIPLVLVMLGVSGAWIGSLTALQPYKPYFLTATALLLAGGLWQVHRRPRRICAQGSYCARPASATITRAALWTGAVVAALAATVNFWAPLFY